MTNPFHAHQTLETSKHDNNKVRTKDEMYGQCLGGDSKPLSSVRRGESCRRALTGRPPPLPVGELFSNASNSVSVDGVTPHQSVERIVLRVQAKGVELFEGGGPVRRLRGRCRGAVRGPLLPEGKCEARIDTSGGEQSA